MHLVVVKTDYIYEQEMHLKWELFFFLPEPEHMKSNIREFVIFVMNTLNLCYYCIIPLLHWVLVGGTFSDDKVLRARYYFLQSVWIPSFYVLKIQPYEHKEVKLMIVDVEHILHSPTSPCRSKIMLMVMRGLVKHKIILIQLDTEHKTIWW